MTVQIFTNEAVCGTILAKAPMMNSSPTGPLYVSSELNTFYGTISCTSSFLMGFTKSSRFTPRYMAMAAATNTDE